MKEAKIFKNGQSQAVRLPKEFRFPSTSVYVNKLGNCVVLVPKNQPWKPLMEACGKFSEDFMDLREQGLEQVRESLD
ncbi:MAG: antitoxin [Fibrobacteria bacterium]|nr:antitoxin [Fibrobacteria bacterium]